MGKDIWDVKQEKGDGYVRDKLLENIPVKEVVIDLNTGDNLAEYEYLPKILSDHLVVSSRTTGAHPDMILGALLVDLSAQLSTTVTIPVGDAFATVYPNVWILLVGDSGTFKSTAMQKGCRSLRKKSKSVYKDLLKLNENKEKMSDDDFRLEYIKTSSRCPVFPPNMTIEAFYELLSYGQKGALLLDEFGSWLDSLGQSTGNKTSGGSFRGFLTELYSPDSAIRKKTKTNGENIVIDPYVCICGCATEVWLRGKITINDIHTGFLPRFLIVRPKECTPLKSINRENSLLEEEFNRSFDKEIQEILNNVIAGKSFKLTPESRERFYGEEGISWEIKQYLTTLPKTIEELMEPFTKRWDMYVLKISIIMQLFFDSKTEYIELNSLEASYKFVKKCIEQTATFIIEEGYGLGDFDKKVEKVLNYIKRKFKEEKTGISKRDIQSSRCVPSANSKTIIEIVNFLIETEQIEERVLNETSKITFLYPKNN